MICGNDPRVRLTDHDRAELEWFREWLAWSKAPEAERGPEPPDPDGNLVSQAAPRRRGATPHAAGGDVTGPTTEETR